MNNAYNEHAANLINGTIDLIEKVLIKHSAAVLNEMHDQIVSRNQEISRLKGELDEANTKGHAAIRLAMDAEERERRLKIRLGIAMGAACNEPPQLPPLTDAMYHAVRGLDLEFTSGGPESVKGSINDDVLDEIWGAINTALRVGSR